MNHVGTFGEASFHYYFAIFKCIQIFSKGLADEHRLKCFATKIYTNLLVIFGNIECCVKALRVCGMEHFSLRWMVKYGDYKVTLNL